MKPPSSPSKSDPAVPAYQFTMKKKIYSFRDGLALVSVAAIVVNVHPTTNAADITDASGNVLVKGAPFSATPADGCWSEVEEYVPGPPAPDERDAEIAALKAQLADLEAANAALTEGGKKDGKKP